MFTRTIRPVFCATGLLALAVFTASANAQTSDQTKVHPSHIPTREAPNGPFGTQWAKPGGTKGSYIYNDPRLIDPYGSRAAHGNTRCPAPMLFDPRSGTCQ